MEKNSLIIILLSSTVVSVIITSIFNIIQKKQDFRTEYFKKILDLRIEALNNVNIYLQSANTYITYSNNKKYRSYIHSKDNYNEFIKLKVIAFKNQIYLDKIIIEKLVEIEYFTLNFDINNNNIKEMQQKSNECYDEMQKDIDIFENYIRISFLNLGNVKKFLKSNSKLN